jgi:hypothetical protein
MVVRMKRKSTVAAQISLLDNARTLRIALSFVVKVVQFLVDCEG